MADPRQWASPGEGRGGPLVSVVSAFHAKHAIEPPTAILRGQTAGVPPLPEAYLSRHQLGGPSHRDEFGNSGAVVGASIPWGRRQNLAKWVDAPANAFFHRKRALHSQIGPFPMVRTGTAELANGWLPSGMAFRIDERNRACQTQKMIPTRNVIPSLSGSNVLTCGRLENLDGQALTPCSCALGTDSGRALSSLALGLGNGGERDFSEARHDPIPLIYAKPHSRIR
jgi:hypothetical protein